MFVSGLLRADSVTNTQIEISAIETGELTLRCDYSTTDSYTVLFWYRKYTHRAMQYILLRPARSSSWSPHTENFAKERFSSTAGYNFTELRISAVTLSDSAVYFCALMHTALYFV
uniref:Ig-like domain-containing protein n=1 Tax=Erpetoichthys calabaricus TaxID=27687 RepID=A0A8C4X6Q6_ERPCA